MQPEQLDEQALLAEWGRRLRQRRTANGWSIEDLARMTDYTTSHVGNVELGRSNPGNKLQFQLASAFGTTVEDLFPYPVPATAAGLVKRAAS